jgi:carboxyl-terminal processing protease
MSRVVRLTVALICVLAFAGPALADDLGSERPIFKMILKNVAGEVSKNFYDAQLKGIDWKAATDEAKRKIDAARSVNEMELAIYQLLEKLDDSHTGFVPPDSAVTAKYGFDAKAYGGEVRVYEVEAKGAADIAGLKVGDRIHQINGFEVERGNIEQLLIYTRKLYQVSTLSLLVNRPDKGIMTIDITPKIVTRSIVQNRESGYNALWALAMDNIEEWRKKYGTYRYGVQEGVGYFQLREFPHEGEDFLKGVAEKTRGSSAVIIDLRGNPGGSVSTLLSFAGLFQATEGPMATEVGRTKSTPMTIKPRRPYFDMPLFVLVDSDTASAGELLARHLQKTRKATVIGDKTSGAVMTSRMYDGEVGAGQVTYYGTSISTARVVFPDGEELEKKGVTPDVTCLPTQAEMRDGKDTCLDKAFALAKEAGKNATPSKTAGTN